MKRRTIPQVGSPDPYTAPDPAGIAAAKKALQARPGKPDAADAPPLSTFPGSPPKQIDGQLGFDDLHRLDGCA